MPSDAAAPDSTALPRAILAAVPATMRELAERTGVHGDELWETVRAMRKAGFVRRGAKRVYALGTKAMPVAWCLGPDVLAAARKANTSKGGSSGRRTATVLVSVPGFPPQDPGRPMIFSTAVNQREACAELKRLMKNVPEASWSVERLTAQERRRIKTTPLPAPRQAGKDSDAG